ncbi:MAG: DEAD/DEAH box helicase [Defluviitaleaceae bacterium]|nr:DEAD/DEAH box helicase [Defluviitaleaceae bacterium]
MKNLNYSTNIENRLAPFIQDYIYEMGFKELRYIQKESCNIIFNTNKNLIIAAGTASGKTEAVFFPIITEIFNNKNNSVDVMYISPLKALINDQFERIEKLLLKADIKVTKWHGESSISNKNKLKKIPTGILQITPESLENMLLKNEELVLKMFKNLKFIIVDEMHYFIENDRGVQLSSILYKITDITKNTARRIGISATIGNIEEARNWINAETTNGCEVVLGNNNIKQTEIKLKYNNNLNKHYKDIYQSLKGRKSIIFSNSRNRVEENIKFLTELSKKNNNSQIFYTHHGNISKENREYIEKKSKEPQTQICIGATTTLELGIDLGDLDIVALDNYAYSVSNLTQRLGRSGRRSGISKLNIFLYNEEKEDNKILNNEDIEILICISQIELCKNGFKEPIKQDIFPFGIFFHQMLSYIHSRGKFSYKLLAQKMLSKYIFRNISKDDFRILLKHLINIKIVEKVDIEYIRLSDIGEKITSKYDFLSVFNTPKEYKVICEHRTIGTISKQVKEKDEILLYGKSWQVSSVNLKQRIVYVNPIKSNAKTKFAPQNSLENFDMAVINEIKKIVTNNFDYNYLDNLAYQKFVYIKKIVNKFLNNSICEDFYISKITPLEYRFFHFLGTKELNTLILALKMKKYIVEINTILDISIKFIENQNISKLLRDLREIKKYINISVENLEEINSKGKYDKYIPNELLKKQYLYNNFDVISMCKYL